MKIEYNYSDGTSECAVEYTYTTDGELSRVDDYISGRGTTYVYNTQGELKEIGKYDRNTMNYYYDRLFYYDDRGMLSDTTDTIDYLVGNEIKTYKIYTE